MPICLSRALPPRSDTIPPLYVPFDARPKTYRFAPPRISAALCFYRFHLSSSVHPKLGLKKKNSPPRKSPSTAGSVVILRFSRVIILGVPVFHASLARVFLFTPPRNTFPGTCLGGIQRPQKLNRNALSLVTLSGLVCVQPSLGERGIPL